MPKPAQPDAVSGVILGFVPNASHVRVRLDTDEEVVAVLPKNRKFGCLFGDLAGWQVMVAFLPPPKMARVVDLKRPAP